MNAQIQEPIDLCSNKIKNLADMKPMTKTNKTHFKKKVKYSAGRIIDQAFEQRQK